MPVSPQDFELWARLTGNEYPRNVHERAALAPEVHNFTRNLGRKGGVRDIARISYDQPDAVAHPNADSLIQAPVTPDNRIPKVAGTHDQSLTSQHYENEQADHAVEQSRFRRAVDIAGKTALVAGGIAGGVALARNPTVQRAAQEAVGAINTHIGDVKTRVSDFLGGMMGNVRTPGMQVVEASGDVTPPTTGQRYSQDVIPSQTRLLQAASGAPPQVDLKDAVSKGIGTNAPTIATSQNFSPELREPLDVASTAAGSANLYRPGKEAEYVPDVVNPLHPAFRRATPDVLAARSSGLGIIGGAPASGYSEGRPISTSTKNWIQQTESPAALGYTHTADPFTGEYTVRSNQPWTGEASVADRAQSFLTELQQTRTTQLPTTQNLLPPAQSISDVTAAGPVAMPGFERSVNFDQQTSDIGVPQSTPISNYAPVNRPSIQDRLAPYYKGSLEYGKKGVDPGYAISHPESGKFYIPGTKYPYQDLRKAINLSATTGDYQIAEDFLKGRALKDLSTTAYAGTSPAGTDVLENVPVSKFLSDISNMKKLPYEVGVTGAEGSIPLSADPNAINAAPFKASIEGDIVEITPSLSQKQKALLNEIAISHPGLQDAGREIKFLRGQEIEALNKKSAADSALQAAIETKRSQLRDPRDIAQFDAAPHLHPSITPYAQELNKWELEHENVVNQLEGKLVPYESLGLLPPTESTASGYQTLKMRSGGKAARTEENLANLGLMRAGSEGTRGFTFLQKADFITKENPLGIYGAEPRQPHKSLYTPELYQTAAETPTNIGFKGLGRGEISPEQVMVTASGKGYRAGRDEGVNPASIADPTIAAQQPWLKTPEGLTYVQRALTSSAEFTPPKERRAALSLLERTHELNEQAKTLKAKGDLQGASDLLMQSVRLKNQATERQNKPGRRGTPEQGANIAVQMQLERDIRTGLAGDVNLPKTEKTDWSQVASSSLYPSRDPLATIRPAGSTESFITAAEQTPKLSARQLQQQSAKLARNKQTEKIAQEALLEQARQKQTARQQMIAGESGRYAEMLTGPEITRRSISGYETPHTPMSEPYNPHLGTRVTQLPPDVLGQTLGPGITPPSRPSDLERYRAQAAPTSRSARQLTIPGTSKAASTPTEADTLRQQLSDYMARRAGQSSGQFRYVEPQEQLSLRFNR
jgi:hypothetical protein